MTVVPLPAPFVLPPQLVAGFQPRRIWTSWQPEYFLPDGKTPKGKVQVNVIPNHPKYKRYADRNDPDTWATFEQAKAYHDAGHGWGMGLMRERDGYVWIDYDCPVTDEEMANMASYAHRSPSGRGCHVIGTISDFSIYDTIAGFKKIPLRDGHIDLIGGSGFVTMRCWPNNGKPIADATAYVRKLLGDQPPKISPRGGDAPPVVWPPETRTPDEIIAKLLTYKNAAKFRILMFNRDVSILRTWYPPQDDAGGHGFDHSSADAALCSFICNETRDFGIAMAIFRMSHLYWRATDGTKRKTQAIYDDRYLIPTFDKTWARKDAELAHLTAR